MVRDCSLDPPKIDRTNVNQSKLAIDSDQYLAVEFHCHLSALPKPTITWLKVRGKQLEFFL